MSPSVDDPLHIIPYLELRKIVTTMGITHLNSIQHDAIQAGLFFHKNLFINTPAGSGKTLIADLAVFNTVLKMDAKVLYLAPYKSLALEKLMNYHQFLQSLNLKVILLTADKLVCPLCEQWAEEYDEDPMQEQKIINHVPQMSITFI